MMKICKMIQENPQQIFAISARELLEVCNYIAEQINARRGQEKRLTMQEACAAYGMNERTIAKRIRLGIIQGTKQGAKWEIETPAQRAERLQHINH